jgi:heme o synthase
MPPPLRIAPLLRVGSSVLSNPVSSQCSRLILFLSPRRSDVAAVTLYRTAASLSRGRLESSYFLSNSLFNGGKPSNTAAVSTAAPSCTIPPRSSDTSPSVNADLPHRRRQAARRKADEATADPTASESSASMPPDASSILTTVAAQHPAQSWRRQLSAFLSLSKPRLSMLVVLSAMVPYALYPVPAFLSPTLMETPSLSPLTLLFLTTGTALCCASANAFNMLYESATDAIMTRTRNRPLVRGLVSKQAAILFAIGTGLTGSAALYFGVNGTVAFLGASNIVIYAGMYTPLKAVTSFNTWIGAIIGGIPPLMGWAAAAGESASGDGSWRELLLASDGSSIGGWLFAGLLFAWQFPHFMALAWPIREEYKATGLRMLAWTNPARNSRVALRYSLVFIPLCVAFCAAGVTEWSFAVTSLPVNGWLAWQAVQFWRFQGHKGSARGLFWASVWHLPVVMVLALAQKKGMWQRVWKSVFGPDDADEWEEDDFEEISSMSATPTTLATPAAPTSPITGKR